MNGIIHLGAGSNCQTVINSFMSNIIIAGDLCPKDRIAVLFDEGLFSEVFEEVKPIIEKADYSLVNLEAPICSNSYEPVQKAGPNLKCNNKVLEAIKYTGFKGVTLANNHLRDYGEDGVLNTIKELEDNGIDYLGAGKDINAAGVVQYKNIGKNIIAFVNCCEHEFSIASEICAGTNPLNPIEQYRAIKEAKTKSNRVIVIVHGGIEYYQYPTPRMVNTYRFFIEIGADIVINHHQHCFSGYEIYCGKPIFYGIGNFCFDWNGKQNSKWNEGYMVNLQLDDIIKFSLIPYIQCDKEPRVILMADEKKMSFKQEVDKLNHIIASPIQLKEKFFKFAEDTWKEFDPIHPYQNRWMKALYKRGLLPSFMNRKKLISIQNKLNCESHLERMQESMNIRINKH